MMNTYLHTYKSSEYSSLQLDNDMIDIIYALIKKKHHDKTFLEFLLMRYIPIDYHNIIQGNVPIESDNSKDNISRGLVVIIYNAHMFERILSTDVTAMIIHAGYGYYAIVNNVVSNVMNNVVSNILNNRKEVHRYNADNILTVENTTVITNDRVLECITNIIITVIVNGNSIIQGLETQPD